MKTLLYGVLTLAMVLGVILAAEARVSDLGERFDRDACPGLYDFGDTQGNYPGRDFDRWRSAQEGRIEDAYRKGNLTEGDYRQLGDELSNIESFHEDSLSLRGRTTAKHQEKLTEMQAQLSGDISVFIQRNCQG